MSLPLIPIGEVEMDDLQIPDCPRHCLQGLEALAPSLQMVGRQPSRVLTPERRRNAGRHHRPTLPRRRWRG